MIKYREPCNVSDDTCEAPAGYGISAYGYYDCDYSKGGGAKHMCFSCGLPVCGKCSKILKYYNFGKQRICNNCITEQ